MGDGIFFVMCLKGKNGVFGGDKVVYVWEDIWGYIRYNIGVGVDVDEEG